ncbi:stromelysin-3-like [Diadema setosum]|uniref:stromelysin-3-like n=1 Tax=Diadema setosum TaxID=31175 RepID=UPI003B3A7468
MEKKEAKEEDGATLVLHQVTHTGTGGVHSHTSSHTHSRVVVSGTGGGGFRVVEPQSPGQAEDHVPGQQQDGSVPGRVVTGSRVETRVETHYSRRVYVSGSTSSGTGLLERIEMEILDLSLIFPGMQATGRSFQRMVGRTMKPKVFLERFGYLPSHIKHTRKAERTALRSFQKFAGLPVTGNMDNTTQMLMDSSRCGVEDMLGSSRMGRVINRLDTSNATSKFDVVGYDIEEPLGEDPDIENANAQVPPSVSRSHRTRRYSLRGRKWDKNNLTYYFTNFTPDLSEAEVREAIGRAFQLWADVTPLTFTETFDVQMADIVIEFAARVHSDGPIAQFDGPGGTLAHAYFPTNGDLHFDEDETFTVRSHQGTNLFIVAAHELGHSLGLEHSSDTNALMYPWYLGYQEDYSLSQDDVDGIQMIYGKAPLERVDMEMNEAPADRPKEHIPDTCNSTWDAATYYAPDDVVYAFKGRYMWAIGDNGVVEGYPKKTNLMFKEAPSLVHAVLSIGNRLYMFRARKMWRFVNKELDTGFPRPIPEGLPSGPNAALRWSGNGKSYFFKGYRFYEFVESDLRVEPPRKLLQQWPGVPLRMDAAFQWKNGRTYFFKGDNYWRYNDDKLSVGRKYPLSRKKHWLGCDV